METRQLDMDSSKNKIPTLQSDIKNIHDVLYNTYDFDVYWMPNERGMIRNFSIDLWDTCENGSCSFCNQKASHSNDKLKLWSCDSCIAYIASEEFDIVNPEDHSVSLFLNKYFKELIDKSYWHACDVQHIYGIGADYPLLHDICYICGDSVLKVWPENELVEIGLTCIGNKSALGHLGCFSGKGLKGFFTEEDYNEILNGIEENF